MDKQKTGWLPVIAFDGIEYVVDVEHRAFRMLYDPKNVTSFYSEKGQQMVKSMIGSEWRLYTTRELWKEAIEGFVECPEI